jgi:hypothetical protein
LFLVMRRAAGDIDSPLPLTLLLPTAAILVAWGWIARFAAIGAPSSPLSFWLPFLAILLFAVGLSYPGAKLIDWFVWITACAALVFGPRWLRQNRHRFATRPRRRRSNRLIQDLKRYRSVDGHEFVRGTLAAEFPPGQRIETLWVGFCPPFEFLPQVTARATGDSLASVKVAEVLHNGAQLEIRLPHSSDYQQVANIEFVAAEPDAT